MSVTCVYKFVTNSYNGISTKHYICYIEGQYLRSSQTLLPGKHLEGKTDRDVSGLIIQKSKIEDFYLVNIWRNIKHVSFIWILDCAVKVARNFCSDFFQLCEISFKDNKIERLDWNFSNLTLQTSRSSKIA
jgi:hypothetical protein